MESIKDITLSDISLKAKSKKEIYMVLTVEGGLYLPPIMDANRNYIRGLINWTKLFLYSKNVKWTKVPQIEKLDLKSILKFGRDNANIDQYLPEYKYSKFPNKDWLCNVINTVVYDEFQLFIKNGMKNRENSWLRKEGLMWRPSLQS